VVLTTPEQETKGIAACLPNSDGYFVNGGVDITVLDGFSSKTACCKQFPKN
jgi:hypothetical protein